MTGRAKPVVDVHAASTLLGPSTSVEEPSIPEELCWVEFFNPHNRVVDIFEPGFTYGLGPGKNVCKDPDVSAKLKAVAANYGIQVYEAHRT